MKTILDSVPQRAEAEGFGEADVGACILQFVQPVRPADANDPDLRKMGFDESAESDPVKPGHFCVRDDDVVAVVRLKVDRTDPVACPVYGMAKAFHGICKGAEHVWIIIDYQKFHSWPLPLTSTIPAFDRHPETIPRFAAYPFIFRVFLASHLFHRRPCQVLPEPLRGQLCDRFQSTGFFKEVSRPGNNDEFLQSADLFHRLFIEFDDLTVVSPDDE